MAEMSAGQSINAGQCAMEVQSAGQVCDQN